MKTEQRIHIARPLYCEPLLRAPMVMYVGFKLPVPPPIQLEGNSAGCPVRGTALAVWVPGRMAIPKVPVTR